MADLDRTLQSLQREQEEKQTRDLAARYKLSSVDLVGYPILFDVLSIIPEEVAKANRLIAYLKAGKTVRVASDQAQAEETARKLQELQTSTGYQFDLVLCSPTSFLYGLELYSLLAPRTKAAAEEVEVKKEDESSFAREIKTLEDLQEKINQVPTTHLLEILFAGALVSEATDIHLEPTEQNLRVRYRIDGVLQDIARLSLASQHALSSRIKYLSKLKLDVRDKPQDGRFETRAADKSLDIRVSTFPTAFGETIEMRLLPREKKFLTLRDLGFTAEQLQIIRQAASKPNGIIFNTGPTGSGKTTTLYAILSELNKPGVKILTLEDPIEYRIAGVDQSQVEPEAGYTFAGGLRAALRQDPDILMVGEIRDQETAEIAMHAAMTGHLVLTTLHTNNAASALPRLLDMKVADYLLAGAINLIIAQRLVRKVCSKCRGRGCTACHKTGFHGRVVIAELLVPDAETERLIKGKGTVSQFSEAAKKAGMKTMLEDGLAKVDQGITNREEILRVTQG